MFLVTVGNRVFNLDVLIAADLDFELEREWGHPPGTRGVRLTLIGGNYPFVAQLVGPDADAMREALAYWGSRHGDAIA